MLAAATACGAGAVPALSQQPGEVEVRDLELPVLDLRLETATLDESFRRAEGEGDVTVTLKADVLFRFDGARLDRRAQSRLKRTAEEIRHGDPKKVSIEGHTDSKGSDAYNVSLSRRRAQAVRRALIEALGPDAPRLTTKGRGESQPVAPNTKPDGSDNPKGRALNRRVEIRIPKD